MNFGLLSKEDEENSMIINLTKSVSLKELCKISVIGNTKKVARQIEFTLSHEAIIGFATELLWIYEDISDSRKLTISTHQLEVDPSPSQALGFYLTPESPMLVFKVNSLTEKEEKEFEYKNWKEISIKRKNVNQYYNVKSPSDEDDEFIFLESYELSKKNIININVLNEEGENVSKLYNTVIFEINRKGIKELATMLFVWGNNCKEGDNYLLPQINNSEIGYNLGILLTQDSISTSFKCHDLGTAYDYDSRI